ncbi:MAG: hypothetical protein N2V76_02045 [Methanophagales archaeon]|nr:hypothetical protein [Methanophagales archaeon]
MLNGSLWRGLKSIKSNSRRNETKKDGYTIISDKGYYGYKNYTMGISRFKVIPAIFPRKD